METDSAKGPTGSSAATHALLQRGGFPGVCRGRMHTPSLLYVTNEFVLASHALSNHNLFSTPVLFNATSRPLFSPRPHPFSFISCVYACVCVCVAQHCFELEDRSSLICFSVQLHHSVSNSVVNMRVFSHECVCACVCLFSVGVEYYCII